MWNSISAFFVDTILKRKKPYNFRYLLIALPLLEESVWNVFIDENQALINIYFHLNSFRNKVMEQIKTKTKTKTKTKQNQNKKPNQTKQNKTKQKKKKQIKTKQKTKQIKNKQTKQKTKIKQNKTTTKNTSKS